MASSSLLGIGGDSWQEEVLLHDGRKIVVRRSQTYGGRHEIGQPAPIREHSIRFNLPDSNRTVEWTSEYGEELGRTNFSLLAVHVLNDTPYLVTKPNLCLSYNKWGRPNPPYVFFKFNGTVWQRIPLEDFPGEFTTNNVSIYLGGRDVAEMVRLGFVSAERIKKANMELRQPEYKTILRVPLEQSKLPCTEMIRVDNGWVGIEWFTSQPTYEKCLSICEIKKMTTEQCPCDRLFPKNNLKEQ